MIRTFTILKYFFVNSLQIEMEYRSEVVVSALNSVLAAISGYVVIYSLFFNSATIGGWEFEECLILFGIFLLIEAFISMILRPNLSRLSEYIRMGSMDYMLLKPVSSQFLVSFRFINIWAFPNLFIGWGLVFYGMYKLSTLSFFTIFQLALMLPPALIIVYSIWCLLNTTAFWWINIENITMLFNSFLEAGRFPISAYPGYMQVILTLVVPVAFITTVPAQAAFEILSFKNILLGWVISGTLLLVSNLLWRYALSKYASASS